MPPPCAAMAAPTAPAYPASWEEVEARDESMGDDAQRPSAELPLPATSQSPQAQPTHAGRPTAARSVPSTPTVPVRLFPTPPPPQHHTIFTPPPAPEAQHDDGRSRSRHGGTAPNPTFTPGPRPSAQPPQRPNVAPTLADVMAAITASRETTTEQINGIAQRLGSHTDTIRRRRRRSTNNQPTPHDAPTHRPWRRFGPRSSSHRQ